MDFEKNISLVLVTFNRSQLLIEMLNSIINQTIKPKAIFLIDNNSSDDTKEKVLEFAQNNEDQIQVFYNNTGANLGGAGGFEIGTRLAFEAGYEWIWLADDDVELMPDCLENLLKYSNQADILQPMRINMDGSCAEVSGIDYEINSLTRLNPKKNTIKDVVHMQWESIPIKTIPFEGPLISRKVFEKIGFPESKFFIFEDDLEFALRAQQAGFEILCIKNATMKRKIPFIQNRALGTWKGYFMYRNFFYVQTLYGKKSIAYLRIFIISLLVLMHSIFTGRIRSLPIFFDALKHALSSNFSENDKYKP